MSEESIVQRLEAKGYKSGEIRATMNDVAKLIIAKTAAAYLELLPEGERNHIQSLPETEITEYLASRQGTLPPMPQETFETIHDQTWEEYFSSVG